MDHRAAKRYAADMLADLAIVRAGLLEGQYTRGETWDQLSPADGRRVVTALRELSEEMTHRSQGRRPASRSPVVHSDQALLFEETINGAE
jgi:hypothetical protein